ncbi:MAG: hypothetical protein KME13_23690 [Myxacorys californica WJT36-NPBG1]|jgi:hypothetical protein|nr:hypothetical protein [Myxacorys californica WJT36-NPBG1]
MATNISSTSKGKNNANAQTWQQQLRSLREQLRCAEGNGLSRIYAAICQVIPQSWTSSFSPLNGFPLSCRLMSSIVINLGDRLMLPSPA